MFKNLLFILEKGEEFSELLSKIVKLNFQF